MKGTNYEARILLCEMLRGDSMTLEMPTSA